MANRAALIPADEASSEATLNDAAVLLSKLGHRAKRMFTQRLEPLRLKANHVQVLVHLSEHPDASQRSMVEALRVTPSTIVELIDQLEARSLVHRTRNPVNRRASVVSITPEGQTMLERALDVSHAVENDLLRLLTARDRRRLLGYLHTIDATGRRPDQRAPLATGESPEAPDDGDPVTGEPGATAVLRDRRADFAVALAAADLADSSSKSDLAYRVLRQWISDGVYEPGDRLVLQQIARDLQISTVPVREAIRRLEAEGFANFQRNVGARVSSIDTARYAEAMNTLAILEGAATAMASEMLTKRDLQRAERINARMTASLGALDPIRFTRANKDFHEVLCRPCANPHLLALIDVEWARLAAIRTSTFALVPERAAAAVQEHRHLLERLRERAPGAEIESLIRTHRMATVHALMARRPELGRATD